MHSQVEDHRQKQTKAGNCQVDPLHIPQRNLAVSDVYEDYERTEDRGNDRANAIKSLADVYSQLSVLWRAANSDIGVRSRFERAQAVADDKDGSAEPKNLGRTSQQTVEQFQDNVSSYCLTVA